ncbi:MAG: gliding motility-associated C-terminal domain-containing protein [Saprospiraceae bacterium]|nr:gliding motility-associated C-terminal domain-containing protein [Saprospiraceae bacterium]
MRYLIFLSVILVSSKSQAQECECDSMRDYRAMKKFAREMFTHPWDTTIVLSDWTGVTLNPEGCVESLTLAGLSIRGFIPDSSLGALRCIRYLDLQRNKLLGAIPEELQNLTLLETLNLSYNELSGQIPQTLGLLLNLNSLYLNDNVFSGPIPSTLGNLTNLESLFLRNNYFTGEIPASMDNLDKLIGLDLSNNDFSGRLPAFFQEISFLTFQVHGNHFRDTAWVNFAINNFGTSVNISNNDFNFLPLITSTGIREEKFMVQKNRFTFDDLLPNFHLFFSSVVFSGIEPERYSPQKPVTADTSLRFSIFEPPIIDLAIDQNIEKNNYKWFKDGKPIFSGSDSELDLNAIFNSASQYPGVYHCEITNQDVPLLILSSGKFSVEVDLSPIAGAVTPGVFTPNGDGVNDFFILPILVTTVITPNELIIYNRNGEKVFRQKDYANQWEGVDLNQQPLPNGTYYYFFTSNDTKESGMVTILRDP